MSDTFYRDFEARFRGPRFLILERLRVYEPFLLPLAAQDGVARALDLGCGRGEWLEILAGAGLEARGVDIDDGMLGAARDLGLQVEKMDALSALKAVPDQTLAVVSAFHLIEHLPFGTLRELIAEARRALRPGGILIFETPNPENPQVGLVNFYLDPTHRHPLPPALTRFTIDHAGFFRSVILRLHGATPQEATAAHVFSLLSDVSLDYAVVAQVPGDGASDLDAAFQLRLGMDLHTGMRRLDDASSARFTALSAEIAELRAMIRTLSQKGLPYDPEAFVVGLYKHVLDRTPSPKEPENHVKALLTGKVDPVEMVGRFVKSPECAKQFQASQPKPVPNEPPEPFVAKAELVVSKGAGGGHWVTHRNDLVIGRAFRQTGMFQEHAIGTAIRLLQLAGCAIGRNCFVDIGANIGSHSIHAAQFGFERVIAFEPDPQNFRLLRANAILQGVDHIMTCHQMAISNQAGTLQMELSPGNFGDHRLRVPGGLAQDVHNEGQRALQDVTVQSFDNLFDQGLLPKGGIDLVWIDTQGHEGHILSAATGLRDMRCPIVLEFWPYGLERSGGYQMLRNALAGWHGARIVDLGAADAYKLISLSPDVLDRMYDDMRQRETAQVSPHTDIMLIPASG